MLCSAYTQSHVKQIIYVIPSMDYDFLCMWHPREDVSVFKFFFKVSVKSMKFSESHRKLGGVCVGLSGQCVGLA